MPRRIDDPWRKLRDGNVVLKIRKGSSYRQVHLKVRGEWIRLSTGKTDIRDAGQWACDQYDDMMYRVRHKQVPRTKLRVAWTGRNVSPHSTTNFAAITVAARWSSPGGSGFSGSGGCGAGWPGVVGAVTPRRFIHFFSQVPNGGAGRISRLTVETGIDVWHRTIDGALGQCACAVVVEGESGLIQFGPLGWHGKGQARRSQVQGAEFALHDLGLVIIDFRRCAFSHPAKIAGY